MVVSDYTIWSRRHIRSITPIVDTPPTLSCENISIEPIGDLFAYIDDDPITYEIHS